MASENQSGGLILGAFMSAKRECDLNKTIDTELRKRWNKLVRYKLWFIEEDIMERCVLIAGGEISDYERVKSALCPGDFYIFCDGGLSHLNYLGVSPHLITGDFDSHEKPDTEVETIVLPREKDDTDSVYAAKEGVKRGFEDFLLLGMTGGRMDHTLGNLSMLLWLHKQGKKALLLDDHSQMMIVSKEGVEIDDSCEYFSLLTISGPAKGVNISGAKYPLSDATILCDYQYGISNEVLPGQKAMVSVREGYLLLILIK